jgi:hypothetical protein
VRQVNARSRNTLLLASAGQIRRQRRSDQGLGIEVFEKLANGNSMVSLKFLDQ